MQYVFGSDEQALQMAGHDAAAEALRKQFKFANIGIWVEKDMFFKNFALLNL